MRNGDRIREAVRCHPLSTDSLLAVVVYAMAQFGPTPSGMRAIPVLSWAGVMSLLVFASLALRSVVPLTVLAVSTLGSMSVLLLAAGWTPTVVATGIAVFTAATRTPRTWVVPLAIGAWLPLVVAATARTGDWGNPQILGSLAWLCFAVAAGAAVRNRRAYVASVEERARRAEQSREEEARRRVAEERLRIARELHDVVAHHIAVVNVQAGVASHLMESDLRAAEEALAHVRRSSRMVLEEIGQLLGVLRQPGDPITAADPAPGIEALDELITGFAASGLQVDWAVDGDRRELPSSVGLVAYRLVQEGLTNAHKHGEGSARLDVGYDDTGLVIRIVNRARAGSLPDPDGTGHGLTGMRERARAVGGDLDAAPAGDGTWRVAARLPLKAAQ